MKTNDVILQTVTKFVLFVIILFSIHLFFAGHYYPGGGFIGGLMTSGAIVLLLLAFDIKTVKMILRCFGEKHITICYLWRRTTSNDFGGGRISIWYLLSCFKNGRRSANSKGDVAAVILYFIRMGVGQSWVIDFVLPFYC